MFRNSSLARLGWRAAALSRFSKCLLKQNPWMRASIHLLVAFLLLTPTHTRAETLTFEVAIRDGSTASPPVLRARKGDSIVINWTTDVPLLIHIHPYQVEQKMTPDKPARMDLLASIGGRFPIEAHFTTSASRHKVVAYLEVLPP
jgi:hypothetical protein